MKTTAWLRTVGKVALAGAILFGSIQMAHIQTADAAVPSRDQFRVALFMNHAKSSVESSVTLHSSSGFDIGLRTSKDTKTWFSTAAGQTIRAALDGYSVQMLETQDRDKVEALMKHLVSASEKVHVYAESRQGKSVYRVMYGHFTKLEDASSARESLLRDSTTMALLGGTAPILTGPLRLGTKLLPNQAEAEKMLETIQKAGFSASIAVLEDGSGKIGYSVWTGNEPDNAALKKLQGETASRLPNVSLQPVNLSQPYILIKADGSVPAGNGVTPYYLFNGSGGYAMRIHSKEPGIAVLERSSRKYRGDLELSQYNGELAVINELPFEEYLYSVVGAEMGGSYPLEALKAQAVISRTYALANESVYDIAHAVDNTYDQAYYGMANETDTVIQAVNATRGEVLVDEQLNPVTAFYSASAGGSTADPLEIWGNPLPHLKSVSSPDEGASEQWHRILLADGRIGYVHGNYVRYTGKKNDAGFSYLHVTDNGLNVRTAPTMLSSLGTVITKLDAGTEVIELESIISKTPYVWERNYSASSIASMLSSNGTVINGPLTNLEATGHGPSGRVTEVRANGQIINAKSPDAIRNIFGSLPSTLFEIINSGGYTIQGASGTVDKTYKTTVYALQNDSSQAVPINQSQYYILGGIEGQEGAVRVVTADTQFTFKGKGYGHGIGLSQYGARNYALQGYTYEQIIQAYFNGVRIAKG